MVIPFSNTKLRVPKGFQSLLVGLSTEVLRSQPRNIHEFAADYFEKLLKRRDQGQSYLPEKQTSLEDRYYNNQSFQEEYPVNDPQINHAATKIQAKFRGHKARQDVSKLKHENKQTVDTDQQELGYGRDESATPNESENQGTNEEDQEQEHYKQDLSQQQHHGQDHGKQQHHEQDHSQQQQHEQDHGKQQHHEQDHSQQQQHEQDHGKQQHHEQDHSQQQQHEQDHGKQEHHEQHHGQQQEQQLSRGSSARSQKGEKEIDKSAPEIEPDQEFPEELNEMEKEEQERAARSIQARFRGFQARKSATQSPSSQEQHSAHQQNQEWDHEKTSTPSSARLSGKLDSDRQDLGGNLTGHDQDEPGDNDDTDRPRLEREPTQLSEDFERHTQLPRDSDFAQEQRPERTNEEQEEEDMDDPNREKAATRIQASFRGYKTRKELSSAGSQDHPQSTSPHPHDEYENAHNKILSSSAEGNKEPEVEDDDNAAAVKIQAAYRGYRTRKDLEK